MQASISPCTTYYDAIIKQERLDVQLGFILDNVKLHLPPESSPKTLYHSNSDQIDFEHIQQNFKKHFDTVSIELRKKIFEIYKHDLTVFGYTWNLSTNKIGGF